MTLLFLLIVACMLLLAFLFILPPLWRVSTIANPVNNDRNIAIAKQRLAELTEQLKTKVLSQAQYDEQRTELERALSDDLDLTKQPNTLTAQGRWMSYCLMVCIPVMAVLLYALLGDFRAINPTPDMLAKPEPTINPEAVNTMVDRLAQKLQAEPNNPQGWLMLGKSYKYLEQYDKAVDAFAKAYQLIGDNPEAMLGYAEALAFTQNQQVTGKAAELVFKALSLETNNPKALWLAGMAKAQANEFSEAKKYWQQLIAILPAGSEEQQEIKLLVAKMDEQMTTGDKKVATNPVTNNISVNVQISLAPELQARTSLTDTVFIYAQATTGSPMPLAIVRKQAKELPVTISLTDELAMQPQLKLSNFNQVKLIARVSKSGNAIPQAGDFIGTIDNVTVNDKTAQTLIINSVVK